MQTLLDDPALAARFGEQSRTVAMEQFNIYRFVAEWEAVFHLAATIKNKTYGKNSIYQ